MRSTAFARAIALFAMIKEAASNPMLLANLPEYVSRGKGKGKHTGKKWSLSSGANMTHVKVRGKLMWIQKENGDREVARRLRQINAGKLQVSASWV